MSETMRYCPVCGEGLEGEGERHSCPHCGISFTDADEARADLGMPDTSEGEDPEAVAGARRALYDAVHAEDADTGAIRGRARDILALSPDDFFAKTVADATGKGGDVLWRAVRETAWEWMRIYAREALILAFETGDEDAASLLKEEEGVKWLKKAAEGGDAGCGLEYADRLMEGRGVVRDAKAALRWYKKAEKGGRCEAARKAGDCYLSGEGTARDPAKAVKKYMKAAEGGDAAAMERLSGCYERGEGVEKDKAKAAEWRERAESARTRGEDGR